MTLAEFLKATITWVSFYILWFVAIMGAAKGTNMPAFYATALMLTLHFTLYRRFWKQEVKLALIVGIIGTILDTLYLNLGIIHYAALGPIDWLCPPWITCLYLQFTCALTVISQRFTRYPAALVVLSCIGGWASYRAGIAVGAAEWGYPHSWIAIALIWAALVPLFCAISRRIYKGNAI